MPKLVLRPIVKSVGGLTALAFLLDNHLGGTAGFILLVSIAAMVACAVVWMIFLREDEDDDDPGLLAIWSASMTGGDPF